MIFHLCNEITQHFLRFLPDCGLPFAIWALDVIVMVYQRIPCLWANLVVIHPKSSRLVAGSIAIQRADDRQLDPPFIVFAVSCLYRRYGIHCFLLVYNQQLTFCSRQDFCYLFCSSTEVSVMEELLILTILQSIICKFIN